MNESAAPRRALILAGGGLKVAFQAGVMQVWLDETRTQSGDRVEFHVADGASGGVFNLAMWCQGYSGKQIADKWRALRPVSSLSLNAKKWLPRFESLLTYNRFRRVVLNDAWNLQWSAIRGAEDRGVQATFNLFNVTEQAQVVLPASEMDEDALVSAVSLPFWFPPVQRADGRYIDAVFATDANLEAAIAGGANELWIIWTVSQRGISRPGPIHEYFQVIEASANSRVRDVLARIARSNEEEAREGGCGEFGRRIEVRWLAAEVPLHYLFDFTREGMQDAVDRGVAAARRWVREQPGLTLDDCSSAPPQLSNRTLAFSEYFKGTFAFGTSDPSAGAALGARRENRIRIKLRAEIDDLDRFSRDPNHSANLTATVDIPALGGKQENVQGEVQLFSDQGDFRVKQLTYRLYVQDADSRPVTLIARKYVPHQHPEVGDQVAQGVTRDEDPYAATAHRATIWVDTTTLYTWLIPGHVTLDNPGEPAGAGIMRVTFFAFLRSLKSTRTSDGVRGLSTYATFFLRQIWQAYGGQAVPPTQPPAIDSLAPPAAPPVS